MKNDDSNWSWADYWKDTGQVAQGSGESPSDSNNLVSKGTDTVEPKTTTKDVEVGTPKQEPYVWVPQGYYNIIYVGHDKNVRTPAYGPNEYRTYIHWKIVTEGPYFGKLLFQSFKDYLKYGYKSKYYRNWTVANGSPPASKSTYCKINVFKNKVFKALIREADSRYDEGPLAGQPLPNVMRYSVVDELTEIIRGESNQSLETRS